MCKLRGIGVDVCTISRMEGMQAQTTFMKRCFTPAEIDYISQRGAVAAASLAGLWAAKEAALKALGVGITIPMTDVEITHTANGQPQYVLHGQALELAQGGSMLLSISHDGDTAIAFCTWSA